ncbi:MAG: hypothetical protein WBE76_14435 [Terracidiphilus sp.]
MVDRLLCFEVHVASASLSKLDDLVLAIKIQFPWKRRFEVLFEELAVPAIAVHEAHIDPVQSAKRCRGDVVKSVSPPLSCISSVVMQKTSQGPNWTENTENANLAGTLELHYYL